MGTVSEKSGGGIGNAESSRLYSWTPQVTLVTQPGGRPDSNRRPPGRSGVADDTSAFSNWLHRSAQTPDAPPQYAEREPGLQARAALSRTAARRSYPLPKPGAVHTRIQLGQVCNTSTQDPVRPRAHPTEPTCSPTGLSRARARKPHPSTVLDRYPWSPRTCYSVGLAMTASRSSSC